MMHTAQSCKVDGGGGVCRGPTGRILLYTVTLLPVLLPLVEIDKGNTEQRRRRNFFFESGVAGIYSTSLFKPSEAIITSLSGNERRVEDIAHKHTHTQWTGGSEGGRVCEWASECVFDGSRVRLFYCCCNVNTYARSGSARGEGGF